MRKEVFSKRRKPDKNIKTKNKILNTFLQFNGKEILHNAVKISVSVEKELAYKEYDKFKIKQDKLYKSDFDNFLNETRMIENGSDENV